jgi:putative FmdB family regulatory protein
MPTYEFHCPVGHEFEKFYRTISGAPSEAACPTCGKMSERKISAGAGLVFKGTGFYITDYGKDGKKDQHVPPHHNGHHNGHVEATIPATPGAASENGHSGNGASSAHETKPSESKPSEPKAAAVKASEPKSSPVSE